MHVTGINPELASPNVCTICETKPENARFVDTGLNNNYVPPSPLTGRKYVCEHCVKHLATAMGDYVDAQTHGVLKTQYDAARSEAAELGLQLEALRNEHVLDFLKQVKASVKPAATTTARKRTP